MKLLKPILFCLVLFLGLSSVTIAAPLSQSTNNILYVKTIPTGSGDCTSWESACGLQDALAKATTGTDIWVAAGTYKPTNFSNPAATFHLRTGVAIYGGFPEIGGEWVERNWADNVTTLSGDIGNPGYRNDNSYHVVTAGGVDSTAILEGFTITAGNAYGSSSLDQRGGGMTNNGDPTLTYVTFFDNSAYMYGGGMYNDGGNPVLTNVTFTGNSCTNELSCGGGGMYNYFASPTLTNITFSGNTGFIYGGGIYNFSSNPKLTNVTFSGNLGNHYGGGIYNHSSSPTLTNVTIAGNTAYWAGSGIYNYWNSNPTITNSIIFGNTSPNQIVNDSSTTTITYSDVEGGYPGTGNISADPLLGGLANNGGFTRTRALDATSPAIDNGNPASCPSTDQRGYERPYDGNKDGTAICDMGAYEYASIPGVFRLSVVVFGNGSVVPPSNEFWYPYGAQVTLTANADPGNSFAGWIGFGSNNSVNLTILGDTIITAYFTQDEYMLSVVPEGSGKVVVSPNQPFYLYGTEVTLIPTAEPGWTFSGWGGDATVSTENKITILGNTNITATFTQDEYKLSVVPSGSGSVNVNPDQETYHYGDEVTLVPMAATDWAFTGWGGDATVSTENKLRIEGNTNITAEFTRILFRVYLPAISK